MKIVPNVQQIFSVKADRYLGYGESAFQFLPVMFAFSG